MTALTTTDDRSAAIQAVLDGLTSPHSKRAYGRALTAFLAWHTAQGRPPLTKAVVTAYKAELLARGKTAAVVNQALSAIRKLALEAADNGAIDPLHAQGIANVAGVKASTLPAGRSLAPGELAALLDTCGPDPAGVRDAAMISLLYSGGLRRAELVALDLADFDRTAAGGSLKVSGKGRKERRVYLEGGTLASLEDWLAVRGDGAGPLFWPAKKGQKFRPVRMTTQAVYHILQERAALAGVTDLSPHDFRRSFIGDLLDAGADIATVQQMAGHAQVTTTARYDRRGEGARRKAAGLLHVPYRRRTLR